MCRFHEVSGRYVREMLKSQQSHCQIDTWLCKTRKLLKREREKKRKCARYFKKESSGCQNTKRKIDEALKYFFFKK